MSRDNNDKIFGAVFGLIEWTFLLKLTAQDKAAIANEVSRAWNNSDRTDHELVAYLLQLHHMIQGVSQRKREPLRQRARDIFKREFARADSSDRARILCVVHWILEGTSRGVTGLAAGAAQSSSPVPRSPLPPIWHSPRWPR